MKIITAVILLSAFHFAQSQTIDKKVEVKTKQRANSRVDRSIDKGLDKFEEGIGDMFKKKKKKKKGEEEAATQPDNGGTAAKNGNTPKANTVASDFVPGATVIFEDKFEKDALADFPALWNTNGSGKLVTIEGVPGKWLDIQHNSTVNPVMDKALPENSTIEFDLFLQSNGGS